MWSSFYNSDFKRTRETSRNKKSNFNQIIINITVNTVFYILNSLYGTYTK